MRELTDAELNAALQNVSGGLTSETGLSEIVVIGQCT